MNLQNMQNFESEDKALDTAEKDLLSILNNKAYLVPDKFSSLLSEHRKKRDDFNCQISVEIKNQVCFPAYFLKIFSTNKIVGKHWFQCRFSNRSFF